MDHTETEETIHLSDYWHVLAKHRLMIAAVLVITVTLTSLFTFLVAPVYRATATLVIDKEQSTSSLTGERVDYESYVSQSLTFNTHFKLVTSWPVMEKVIDRLHLDQLDREQGLKAGIVTQLAGQLKENIRLLLGLGAEPLTPQDRRALLVEKVREKIDIENVRDTRLLRINVEDPDPVLATEIANELSQAYIELNISNRLASSRNTLAWMTDHLYETKKKLEDAEQAFLAYKQREKLFSIQGKQKVITQKIEEFNDAYLDARNKRQTLDAKLEELQRLLMADGNISHVRSVINNPLIDNLYAQLIDAEVELNKLGKVFKHRHPKVLQATGAVENTRKKLKEELKKEKENIRVARNVLFSREKVMEKNIADFEDDALATNRKGLNYNILSRNVETNQQLYDILLSKIKAADIEGNQDSSNIRIAAASRPPIQPVKPKKKLNLLLSVIFGLMSGVGLAFFREYMDRTLHNSEDVQRYLDLPVMAVIPLAEKRKIPEPLNPEPNQ